VSRRGQGIHAACQPCHQAKTIYQRLQQQTLRRLAARHPGLTTAMSFDRLSN
jgi:hypothetical protein